MTAQILDGRSIAAEILQEVSAKVRDLSEAGWSSRLISIKVGESAAVEAYVRNQRAKAEEVGIEFEEKAYPASISVSELRAAIAQMNVDPRVTGIMLQRPVPDHIPVKALQDCIHPLKDIEGMHPASIGNIVYNELRMGPCTALASVELLRRTGLQLKGLEVTMIGHSEIVGKPIAFLLMAEGATVTVCHHMTRDVPTHSKRADAVFVAVGKPGLVTGDMLKSGSVLIDIGINRITGEDSRSNAMLMRNAALGTSILKNHYEAQFQSSTPELAMTGTESRSGIR